MQGKVASDQRTVVYSTAGIDVGQEWLDAHIRPCGERLRVANDSNGQRKLKRLFRSHNVVLVVVEATGKWHRAVVRSLHADRIAVAQIDPYRVRHFARANLVLAKNDKLDASALSAFGQAMDTKVRPPKPEIMEELGELARGRLSAVKEKASLQNQLSSATTVFLRRHLQQRVKRLKADIEALEKEIVTRIKADPGLARRYEILTSIPGVALKTAVTFIAMLSELGNCTAKGIAKLVGVAPLDDDSGKRHGRRHIWGGRAAVRHIAFMAALTAIEHNPGFKAFYARLTRAGKEHKEVMVAVIRKLVILANTLIAEDRLWELEAPKRA